MKYQAKKKNRIKYRFIGITTIDKDPWWFNEKLNQWENQKNTNKNIDCDYNSHQDCKSVKAFKRKLKKCPKGVEFILVNKWVGYDVYGKNTTKNGKMMVNNILFLQNIGAGTLN